MPEIHLVNLFAGPVELPDPGPDSSYIVYKQTGLKESAIHPFIRLVPPLGLAMAKSALPLELVENVAKGAAALAAVVEHGISLESALEILEAVK